MRTLLAIKNAIPPDLTLGQPKLENEFEAEIRSVVTLETHLDENRTKNCAGLEKLPLLCKCQIVTS